MPFSQKYLKDYEAKIRKLPLEERYDILSSIRDDPFKADESPERVKIVEKRIRELDPKDINKQGKYFINQIPTKELNEKLEEEFKKKPHPKSAIIKIIGWTSVLFGFLFIPAKNENGLSLGMIFVFIGLICFACVGLIEKRITVRGGAIHKIAHPVAFWCIIITEILGALMTLGEIICKGF